LPGDEPWTIYNISTKTAAATPLLSGYKPELKQWLRLESEGPEDLAIVYYDCWGCEAASFFTAFHFDPVSGWRARWPANGDSALVPGVAFLFTDVGDPYDDEEVDQVFSVLEGPGGLFSAGTWYHSRDLKTGKVTEEVRRYSFDALRKVETNVLLTGPAATRWKSRLCSEDEARSGLAVGQDSKSCKRLQASAKPPGRK
jgi:hypothetical protein